MTNVESSVPSTQPVDTDELLSDLRAELDDVDEKLRENLRRRLEIVAEVGRLKREHRIPVMQNDRVDAVTLGARRFAERHDLNPDFFAELYGAIIAEACRIEDEVVADTERSDTERADI